MKQLNKNKKKKENEKKKKKQKQKKWARRYCELDTIIQDFIYKEDVKKKIRMCKLIVLLKM